MEIIIIISVLIILNITVSVYICKRDDLDAFQIKAQLVMVWLIPFIAAIGLWFFNRSHNDNPKLKQPFGGGEQSSIDVGGGSPGAGGGSD